MVVIVDPHLKRTDDYLVYKQAKEIGILVKQKNGQDDYEGWCWPGSSSWIDFFNPASWDFWKSLFKTTKGSGWSWTESTEDIHIWNDMNEVRTVSILLDLVRDCDCLTPSKAFRFQRTRDYYAQGLDSLWGLGAS
jgi:alpha-glucosidase (family GH31 glycosyl hydrolase)